MNRYWIILVALLVIPAPAQADETGFRVATDTRVLHSLLAGLMGPDASLQLLVGDPAERKTQLDETDLVFWLGAKPAEPAAGRRSITASPCR